ncbi:hypothetical protein SB748_24995 [Rhizobium sp. SIMBA_035]
MSTTCWPKAPLVEEDVDCLDRVLRGWCARRDLAITDDASRLKARELIGWYEFGVRNPAELAHLIEDDGV